MRCFLDEQRKCYSLQAFSLHSNEEKNPLGVLQKWMLLSASCNSASWKEHWVGFIFAVWQACQVTVLPYLSTHPQHLLPGWNCGLARSPPPPVTRLLVASHCHSIPLPSTQLCGAVAGGRCEGGGGEVQGGSCALLCSAVLAWSLLPLESRVGAAPESLPVPGGGAVPAWLWCCLGLGTCVHLNVC